MADLINEKDTLNSGRVKINTAIKQAENADNRSIDALNIAEDSKETSESVRRQLDQVLIDGDSSVEAAQARVDAEGVAHRTLKERLDSEHMEVNESLNSVRSDLAQMPSKEYVVLETTKVASAVSGGRKAYRTLAEVDKPSLSENSIVEVTNDGENNGTYHWDGVTLVKSDYDPLNAARTYTDLTLRENDGTRHFGVSAFSSTRAYGNDGTAYDNWYGWRSTEPLNVDKGDTINLTTGVNANSSVLLVYDLNHTIIDIVTADVEDVVNVEYTFKNDGYFITQHKVAVTDSPSFTLNAGKPIFITPRNLENQPTLKAKSDAIEVISIKDFELGYVDTDGNEIDSTYHARSSVYKFEPGTVMEFNRVNNDYVFGYNTSQTEEVRHTAGHYFTEEAITRAVPEEQPYVRFFIRSRWGDKEVDLSTAINLISIKIDNKVMYEQDVYRKIDHTASKMETKIEKIKIIDQSPSNPNFKTPSLAEGGVVSFIDDDGVVGVHDILYPFFKQHNAPFATAVVPSIIGGHLVGRPIMTFEQLMKVASDTEIVEVMNHTYKHWSLPSLSDVEVHEQVGLAKKWLIENGIKTEGFVLPFGASDERVLRIVQHYYNACYDFASDSIETFDSINNRLISRSSFGIEANRLETHKNLVDQAAAENGWLVITLHVTHEMYWNETSLDELEQLIDYIRSKNVKILKPRDGFQIFGNIAENDSGFKIQANGKIVGAS